ncbi:MAG: NAD-glutamate dehydrogenase [Proteobacteria bacterium]|nr:NAD-glutamate dehydrogenase [Pseudomonadota bacterium]
MNGQVSLRPAYASNNPLKATFADDNLHARLKKLITAHAPKGESKDLLSFADIYFRGIPSAEMTPYSDDAILKQITDAYVFFSKPLTASVKVAASNPAYSHNTVIHINMPDQPFLVDSVWAEIGRLGYEVHHTFHPIIATKRDGKGNLKEFAPAGGHDKGMAAESLMHVECDRAADGDLKNLQNRIQAVLEDARTVVEDFPKMTGHLQEILSYMKAHPGPIVEQHAENLAFVEWLLDNHFIFLGYRKYDVTRKDGKTYMQVSKKTGLGIMRDDATSSVSTAKTLEDLAPNMRRYISGQEQVTITKALTKSTVHRRADMDYLGIKMFDKEGRAICEHRFLGLFTSRAYTCMASDIPLIRQKIYHVLEVEGNHATGGHNHRTLVNILETYPRDELFQISTTDLQRIASGILHLKARQHCRLFVRRSDDERLVSAMVYVPRDKVTRNLRSRIQKVLATAYQAQDVEYQVYVGDLPMARLFFKIRVEEGAKANLTDEEVEKHIIKVVQSWDDALLQELTRIHGEHTGLQLHRKYAGAFRAGYREYTDVYMAATDVMHLEKIDGGADFAVSLAPLADGQTTSLKIFRPDAPVNLSDIMPIMDRMGLFVAEEHPNKVKRGDKTVWIHDFHVRQPDTSTREMTDPKLVTRLTEALRLVWAGEMDNDRLNSLITGGNMGVEAIIVLRAFVAYMQQTATKYSQEYIRSVLVKHPKLAGKLWKIFETRFSPAYKLSEAEKQEKILIAELNDGLRDVSVLDEDVIIRQILAIIRATVRTNAFARASITAPLAFKIRSSSVPDLPKPHPLFEIFVYHTVVEGVHLRGGKVARGGIRWSDRVADYRTEVLGLMKTQMTKNAVIVPVGSKGGFVLKKAPCDMKDLASCDRDTLAKAVKDAYSTYIRTLLTVTDNIVDGKVITPVDVRRYDDEDPYFVVAADKGTATFSDTANGISADMGFWLGDAFASGGSQGYDHKGMAITARGAWECVKRHFRELGTDIQSEDFTVVGIGDMAGDVFGNGMLLSKHICLQVAFNHMHIFIDPTPDAAKSWTERKRLFTTPHTTWADYDAKLISKGGGVFSRKAKSIPLSAEMKKLLKLNKAEASPNEIIRAALKMEVDLLWNGGIGTFIKAVSENNVDVGDRANDDIRINGKELKAKVAGEGGNLGMTQLGRIEYALSGGRLNTDAVDNSAGVACSDHEVNIKILLTQAMLDGKLDIKARNKLLAEMTDEVAALVLRGNYLQSQIISQKLQTDENLPTLCRRLMRSLEKKGMLDRKIEFLPDDEAIDQRIQAGKPLTRPEVSVLLAYAKMDLYNNLLASDLPDDAALLPYLVDYFPTPLGKKFRAQMENHRLRREIIATQVTNEIVNRMGMTFVARMREETGHTDATIARAFILAKRLYQMDDKWAAIQALDNKIPAAAQMDMLEVIRKLAEYVTFWFLRNGTMPLSIEDTFKRFEKPVTEVIKALPKHMTPSMIKRFNERVHGWQKHGLPKQEAEDTTLASMLNSAQDVAATALATGRKVPEVMDLHFRIGERLQMDVLHIKARNIPIANNWQRVAALGIIDDLYTYQKDITAQVIRTEVSAHKDADGALTTWLHKRAKSVDQYERLLSEIKGYGTPDHAMFNVVLGQLKGITSQSVE